uniref:Uncharacterized protein n=1 Tax=Candidatus Kentrum sp. SD TaxID=2126332 RepID=A0A450YGY8_9GAMM|nr:MAG: hypothetical protein BECKSD772F_GA0070984_106811 [Candidatus Kentron sp. SD]VFK46234.1 MAG: hypothetical protein BECKSD772E_GA0070983_106910 [Candidatus Kentron sp. SD]
MSLLEFTKTQFMADIKQSSVHMIERYGHTGSFDGVSLMRKNTSKITHEIPLRHQ